SLLLVAALITPFAMVKVQPPSWLGFGMAVSGGVIAFMVLLMVRREGARVLHFVTLFPTILAVAFLLRPASRGIDQYKSAHSLHERLVALGTGQDLPAVFHVRRELAYGLNFYYNKPVFYYGPDGPSDMPPKTPPEPPVRAVQLEKPPRPPIPIEKH